VTLRQKTILIILAALGGMLAIFYLIAQDVLLESILALEERNISRDIQRVLDAIGGEIDALDALVYKWAANDVTYALVENSGPDDGKWAALLKGDPSFTGFAFFFDSAGQRVFGRLHDREEGLITPAPEWADALDAHERILSSAQASTALSGVIMLGDSPALAAVHPILTGEDQGPVRGTVMVGRRIDDAFIYDLSDQTHLTLFAVSPEEAPVSEDWERYSAAPLVTIRETSAEMLSGYVKLRDVYGNPAFFLRVDVPREMYEQARTTIGTFLLFLLISGVTFGAAILLLLERFVIMPLSTLSGQVREIGGGGGRVTVAGQDELSNLAADINRMLDALEQSQSQLRESETRYRSFVQNFQGIAYRADPAFRLKFMHGAVEQITGYTEDDFLSGRVSWDDIVHPDDEGRFIGENDFRIICTDGEVRWLNQLAQVLRDEAGNVIGVQGAAYDVTQRRQAEDSLVRRNLELTLLDKITQAVSRSLDLSRLLDTLADLLADEMKIAGGGIFLYGDSGERLSIRKIWGLPESVIKVEDAVVVFSEEDSAYEIPHFLDIERLLPEWQGYICVPILAEDTVRGQIALFSRSSSAFNREEVAFFRAVGQQVGVAIQNAQMFETIRQQHHELRALTAQLEEVREEERQHLAQELHDSVGQKLAALSIHFKVIQTQIPGEGGALAFQHLESSQALVEEITQHIRDVVAELRPSVLSDYGLAEALESYADRFADQMGIPVQVAGDTLEGRLADSVETVFYRIAQEALTNIMKHAQAQQVTIRLAEQNGTVRMTIDDDGVGFDTSQPAKDGRSHWGLLIMQERANVVGARCSIESAPGEGTRIIVEVTR
jgi:PAS domain S-box-containing protein